MSARETDSVRAVPIGGERFTTTEAIEVRSPFDGHLIGRVPACGAADVGRAVDAASVIRRAGALPAWRRAEILDHAARLLDERVEAFARTIAEEAAKPIKTARVEAAARRLHVHVRGDGGATLTGEMIPMDAADVGEGKLAFTLRVPIGVVGAISPFNFPLNLVAHKLAPAIAAGCPVVLKPASQTPLSAIALATLLLDECGLPDGHLNVVTGGGGTVGNAIVDHPRRRHDHLHRVARGRLGHPGHGPPRKKVGLELGNNAPVILEPDADFETAAKKITVAGFSHAGQSCISTQRVYVHECDRGEVPRRAGAAGRGARRRRPARRGDRRVRADLRRAERDRVRGVGRARRSPRARRSRAGGEIVRDGVLAPTVLTDVDARHEGVLAGGVRPGRRRRRRTPTSTTRCGSPTTPATASRRRSSRSDLDDRVARRARRSTSAACS